MVVEVDTQWAPEGLGAARRAQIGAEEPVSAAAAYSARRMDAKMASLAKRVQMTPPLRTALKLPLQRDLERHPRGAREGTPAAPDPAGAAAAPGATEGARLPTGVAGRNEPEVASVPARAAALPAEQRADRPGLATKNTGALATAVA